MGPGFRSPPDPRGFNLQVWELVRQIPPGRVATYGQVAAYIRPPQGVEERAYLAFGPRWVGGAMASCPGDVPWQRVVNSQGKISPRRGGSHLRQRAMLAEEGVLFDERERIDLGRFGWSGPDAGRPEGNAP